MHRADTRHFRVPIIIISGRGKLNFSISSRNKDLFVEKEEEEEEAVSFLVS